MKWDRLLLLRKQLEADPTKDEEEEEKEKEKEKEEGKEGRRDALARAVASRLAGVEAALQRIRCVSTSTDEWQTTGGGSPVCRQPSSSSSSSSSSSPPPTSPPPLTHADTPTSPSTLSSPTKHAFAIGVRKDILEVLEARTTEEVAQAEALSLTPSSIQARLQVCGFPHGDLSDFRVSGTCSFITLVFFNGSCEH